MTAGRVSRGHRCHEPFAFRHSPIGPVNQLLHDIPHAGQQCGNPVAAITVAVERGDENESLPVFPLSDVQIEVTRRHRAGDDLDRPRHRLSPRHREDVEIRSRVVEVETSPKPLPEGGQWQGLVCLRLVQFSCHPIARSESTAYSTAAASSRTSPLVWTGPEGALGEVAGAPWNPERFGIETVRQQLRMYLIAFLLTVPPDCRLTAKSVDRLMSVHLDSPCGNRDVAFDENHRIVGMSNPGAVVKGAALAADPRAKGEPIRVETRFADYRPVNGWHIPHVIVTTWESRGSMTFSVDQATVDGDDRTIDAYRNYLPDELRQWLLDID